MIVLRLIIALVSLFGGCAAARPMMAPPPFTAEEIRDATKPGRTYVFEATGPDGTTRSTMKFVAVDAEGADIESGGKTTRSTWAELVGHATFLASATTIAPGGEIEVPAGKFVTMLYTVVSPDGMMRFWFAKTLPGAPIRFEKEKDGKVVQSSVLAEHLPGGH